MRGGGRRGERLMKAKEEGEIKRDTVKRLRRGRQRKHQTSPTMTLGGQQGATADNDEQQQQRIHLPLRCTQPTCWTMQHSDKRRPQTEATTPRRVKQTWERERERAGGGARAVPSNELPEGWRKPKGRTRKNVRTPSKRREAPHSDDKQTRRRCGENIQRHGERGRKREAGTHRTHASPCAFGVQVATLSATTHKNRTKNL